MSLKTSLHSEHLKLKAKMADFAGFDMPIQYSSVKDESLAVRNNVGVFDVSHMGEFFVEGKDAIKFVDHLITNDFSAAEVGKAVYSPLCREDGTVIDDLIAYKIEEQRILICVNAANIDKDWQWISNHTNDFDVKLTNESDNYSLLAVQGPKSEGILKQLELFPEGEFGYYSAKEFEVQNEKIILARTGYTGEDGFEIFAGHDFIKNLWQKLLQSGVEPCGLAARDVLRLEVCYPLYGHEMDDSMTPLDAALGWTVKLDKKDFIGKSALENHKSKYRLAKLSLAKGIPRQGYSVENENGDIIGEVTSGTMSVTLGKGVALAKILREKFPEEQKFVINIRNRKFEAEFHKKAFVTGGHK